MLNPQQREAVGYVDGPLLVLAGAGSGKTAVISSKIAHLVRNRHAPAERIAAITFTNKAAREMRERVAKLVDGETAKALMVSTFHSLGLRFLHIDPGAGGLKRGFSVLDAGDSAAVIKELAPAKSKPDALFQIRSLLSRAKNAGLTPEAAVAAAASAREQQAAEIYGAYQRRLQAWNAVDFDDLIRLPLAALEADSELRAAWGERLRYLLVDEYQDTNEAQYRLLKALAGERGAFTCVGDDDQSIYGWRGADPENMARLHEDWPALKVIKLEQNYRCGRRILRAANRLIGHNPHLAPKTLWSELPEGPPIRILECRDSEHEAERVAGLMGVAAKNDPGPWHRFAVLYRGNHQSRPLEKALRLAGIPYHLSGQIGFLDRAEVRDVLAYLRLLANPRDDAAFLRVVNVPRREVGATTLEKLGRLAQSRGLSLLQAASSSSVLAELSARPAAGLATFAELLGNLHAINRKTSGAELVEQVLAQSGYRASLAHAGGTPQQQQRRLDNIKELADWFRAMEDSGRSGDLAAQLALLGRNDEDDGGNAVRLMTLHSAKGLEFDNVYLIGCADGVLPHEAAIDEGRVEEERRLMYVGVTRAKKRLTLSWPKHVRRFGETSRNKASRFLDELPQTDLHWQGRDAEADAEAGRASAAAARAELAELLGTKL